MRTILLAAALLGALLASPGPAGAGGCLGRSCVASFGFGAPVVVAPYAPYAAYPYPYYASPVYPPVVYGPSYFRPEAPYAWNAMRNWRDTWQDDGVKVHSYTLR